MTAPIWLTDPTTVPIWLTAPMTVPRCTAGRSGLAHSSPRRAAASPWAPPAHQLEWALLAAGTHYTAARRRGPPTPSDSASTAAPGNPAGRGEASSLPPPVLHL
eukprot:654106-Prorocentrum_minimum.AAC.1